MRVWGTEKAYEYLVRNRLLYYKPHLLKSELNKKERLTVFWCFVLKIREILLSVTAELVPVPQQTVPRKEDARVLLMRPWTSVKPKVPNDSFHTEIANQDLKNFSCSWAKIISFIHWYRQILKAACSIRSPKCPPERVPRPFKPWGGVEDSVLTMSCIRGPIHKIFILKQKMCLSAWSFIK